LPRSSLGGGYLLGFTHYSNIPFFHFTSVSLFPILIC
jgi:hypothetical protein